MLKGKKTELLKMLFDYFPSRKAECNYFLGDGTLGFDYIVYGNIREGKKQN